MATDEFDPGTAPMFPEVVTQDGEVLSSDKVAYSYTREGRHKLGVEYPNPTPIEPPLGFRNEVPLYEQMREMIRRELSQAAAEHGEETFEEADDFDIDDDFDRRDPQTPYEALFEPEQPWGKWSDDVLQAELAARAAIRGGEGGQSPPSQSPSPAGPEAPPTPGPTVAPPATPGSK